MQPTTNLLFKAMRKALKFLQRDFFELEMLQSSNRGTEEFCNKSYLRVKELLLEELQRYYKQICFADEKKELIPIADNILLVQPIDGLNNFSKSLPFFCTIITLLKNNNNNLTPTHCVIYFPALDEIYYAEKGNGAWSEKSSVREINKASRLRVSNFGNLEKAIIASEDMLTCPKIFKNIRNFGSSCYHTCLFVAGKLDGIYSPNLNFYLKTGLELLVLEAGGFLIKNEKNFLVSNPPLADKIKQFI